MLKRWLILGCIVVVVLVVAAIWQGLPKNTEVVSLPHAQVVSVEALMHNVDQYLLGQVTVEGVVSITDTPNRTLTLIDIAEFQECDVTNCATLMLPVHWSGPMPQSQSFVRAKGEVQKQNGRFVFVAQTLEQMQTPSRLPE